MLRAAIPIVLALLPWPGQAQPPVAAPVPIGGAVDSRAEPGGGRSGRLFGARARYRWAVDPASSHRLAAVQERDSGQWAWRECDLRVARDWPLPQPLQVPGVGAQLSMERYTRLSVATAEMHPAEHAVHGAWRRWRFGLPLQRDDLDGRTAYAVVERDRARGEARRHFFANPALRDQAPEQWGEWQRARHLRGGSFGWWDELHGPASAASQALPGDVSPFELRCRIRLRDIPQPGDTTPAAELLQALQREEPVPR